MAGAGEHSRSLKEALVESLNSILSPLQNVRASGEEQIKALEVTEGIDNINTWFLLLLFSNTCFCHTPYSTVRTTGVEKRGILSFL